MSTQTSQAISETNAYEKRRDGLMARSGDFSRTTIMKIAKRAGFRCSFPKCNNHIYGPSDEKPDGVSYTGEASHIFAAGKSKPARRINKSLPPSKIKAFENGILMCNYHGTLIDQDETTYTPDILQQWKAIAEKRAQLSQQYGTDFSLCDSKDIFVASLSATAANNELVGKIEKIIDLSYIRDIWGKSSELTLRDLALEIGQNALMHGKADRFTIEITPKCVRLVDNGMPFSHYDLLNASNPRGGAYALSQTNQPTSNLLATYQRNEVDATNETVITPLKHVDQVMGLHPCSVHIEAINGAIDQMIAFSDENAHCKDIYVTFQSGIISYSTSISIAETVKNSSLRDKNLFLILREHSQGIKDFFKMTVPNVKIVEKI